jgi:hypothetical protein
MKLSVAIHLLDLGQSVGLLGRVISSSQGLYLYTNTEKYTQRILYFPVKLQRDFSFFKIFIKEPLSSLYTVPSVSCEAVWITSTKAAASRKFKKSGQES